MFKTNNVLKIGKFPNGVNLVYEDSCSSYYAGSGFSIIMQSLFKCSSYEDFEQEMNFGRWKSTDCTSIYMPKDEMFADITVTDELGTYPITASISFPNGDVILHSLNTGSSIFYKKTGEWINVD